MNSAFNYEKNPLLLKSFSFALQIIAICKQLQSTNNFILANQLLKSGTSIGANIREAQACESRADFIHKLKIAAKETQETEYWLLLLKESNTHKPEDELFKSLLEIQKMLTKSIATAKNNI